MNRATALGSLAIVLWSSLALLSRTAASVPPFQLTAMAFAVSGTLGLVWLAATRSLAALRQPAIVWLHGADGLFGYHALFFAALATAPAAEANLLNYLWPLLIVLLSAPVLGLRLNRRHLAGVAIGLTGSLLLLLRGTNFSRAATLGYACAIGAAFTWAAYSVLARRLSAVPTQAVAGFCAATAILAALAHLAFETTVTPSPPILLAVLLLGIGPVGIAFLLWDIGMKQGDPRLLGTLAYATPVASTVVLGLSGYAKLTAGTLVAAGLVAAGGWIAASASRASIGRRRAPPRT